MDHWKYQSVPKCPILVSSASLDAACKKLVVTGMIRNQGLIDLYKQMLSFCYTIAFEDS